MGPEAGGCGYQPSLMQQMMERMFNEHGEEAAVRAVAVDAQSYKVESQETISLYRLIVGNGTVLSPDFGNEPVTTWTSKAEPELWEAMDERSKEIASKEGTVSAFFYSPGYKEDRAYVWQKQESGEIKAVAYTLPQLSNNSRWKLLGQLNSSKPFQGEKTQKNLIRQTIFTDDISHQDVAKAVALAMNSEEKEQYKDYLNQFYLETAIPDTIRWQQREQDIVYYQEQFKQIEKEVGRDLESLAGQFTIALVNEVVRSGQEITGGVEKSGLRFGEESETSKKESISDFVGLQPKGGVNPGQRNGHGKQDKKEVDNKGTDQQSPLEKNLRMAELVTGRDNGQGRLETSISKETERQKTKGLSLPLLVFEETIVDAVGSSLVTENEVEERDKTVILPQKMENSEEEVNRSNDETSDELSVIQTLNRFARAIRSLFSDRSYATVLLGSVATPKSSLFVDSGQDPLSGSSQNEKRKVSNVSNQAGGSDPKLKSEMLVGEEVAVRSDGEEVLRVKLKDDSRSEINDNFEEQEDMVIEAEKLFALVLAIGIVEDEESDLLAVSEDNRLKATNESGENIQDGGMFILPLTVLHLAAEFVVQKEIDDTEKEEEREYNKAFVHQQEISKGDKVETQVGEENQEQEEDVQVAVKVLYLILALTHLSLAEVVSGAPLTGVRGTKSHRLPRGGTLYRRPFIRRQESTAFWYMGKSVHQEGSISEKSEIEGEKLEMKVEEEVLLPIFTIACLPLLGIIREEEGEGIIIDIDKKGITDGEESLGFQLMQNLVNRDRAGNKEPKLSNIPIIPVSPQFSDSTHQGSPSWSPRSAGSPLVCLRPGKLKYDGYSGGRSVIHIEPGITEGILFSQKEEESRYQLFSHKQMGIVNWQERNKCYNWLCFVSFVLISLGREIIDKEEGLEKNKEVLNQQIISVTIFSLWMIYWLFFYRFLMIESIERPFVSNPSDRKRNGKKNKASSGNRGQQNSSYFDVDDSDEVIDFYYSYAR